MTHPAEPHLPKLTAADLPIADAIAAPIIDPSPTDPTAPHPIAPHPIATYPITIDPTHSTDATPPRKPWLRLALLLAFITTLYLIAHTTGATTRFTIDGLRAHVDAAGPIGAFVFVLCFIVGNLIHLPGMIFVVVALLAYGQIEGTLLALAGGLIAVTTSFTLVRAIGGTPLAAPRHPWVRTLLAHLDRRPVQVIALLRIAFQFSPPVNYALALSPVRLRHYLLGSALGLTIFMTGVALLFEEVLTWFS